jgi:Putative beta-barrel porin-2, OmpL-like. bbp2/Carboxypeptidase regulatory-like domain
MKIRSELRALLISSLAATLLSSLGQAAESGSGTIVGIVTNAKKLPVAQATVTAVRSDGGIRSTLSGSDGVYSFADLPPGKWAITSHVEGTEDVTIAGLDVLSNKATRSDVVMSGAPASAGGPSSLVAAAAALVPTVPLGLQAPDPGPPVDNDTPFAFADFTWMNATPRNKAPAFDTKFFTPDVRFDVNYMYDKNHPQDHTISGSTESFRSGEFQLEQISFGGDFHWDNVKARLLTMYGLFATTTPRNDASSGNVGGVGQWDLQDAYKYVSEANAGYHFDVNHGLNVDAGIFVSYIGLFSYYNYDNWTYQPSYVSSNTPWFFNGLRVQWFPTNKLKIEPWLINGWQSYSRFNRHPGFGGQILWQPTGDLKLVFNNYAVGEDNLQNFPPGEIINGKPVDFGKVQRIHTDDSIEVKYYENHENGKGVSKMAFTVTVDAGCQYGGGVTCTGGVNKSNFLGAMAYNRWWFHNDLYAITVGGGFMNNPGRYLTLLPPVNGASASTGTPYFTELPGQRAYMYDSTLNFQYMPKDWITWWSEMGYRHSSIPYFNGVGGMTPPFGNNGSPASYSCYSGSSAGTNALSQATSTCSNQGGVWFPDLRQEEFKISAGLMIKF